MRNYINLHTHGVYSFLDGHGKYESYADYAKELGMAGLGITEHGNVHGWLDFYEACKNVDIKPILGIEMYQARKTRHDKDPEERAGPSTTEWGQRGPYHLTVLAKDITGYHNIIKLSSLAYTEGFYTKPRIDHELISTYAEGIIVLSGCLSGEVQQALLRGDYDAALKAANTMQSIVGPENYFIEIHDHGIQEEKTVHEGLISIAKAIGAKIVATGDCHYVKREDSYHHDVMLCVATKSLVSKEDRFQFVPEEFYLKSYDEMLDRFEPEWLESSLVINEMVNVELEFNELYFPSFPDVPEGKLPNTYLKEMVWQAASDRYPEITEQIERRIDYELGVIERMGFEEYFLVVADIVNWAKQHKIRVGYGRGSAAGSIISYILGITNLDPIKFNLMFERFLVEGRKSPPDIDLDFDDRYRDQVVEYAKNKYGKDRVVNIATFSSLGAKGAIRDVARVLGYDYKVGDKISKLVPSAVLGVTRTIDESLQTDEMMNLYQSDPDAKLIIDTAKGLEGIYRQPGVHAAGIVISKGPIIDYVPVMQKGEKAPIVTQWDYRRIDQSGMLKIDFLGLRNLSIIDICIENIKQRQGIDVDLDVIPEEDEASYAELKHGNTSGIFQLESPGITRMTQEVQPNSIEDIMAIMALYRPGPMGSNMGKMYINRRHGQHIDYYHPSLKQVLGRSYGLMLYQEDILAVAGVLAGFTVPEADDLRKAIGKKELKKIGLYREKFVEGCQKTSEVSVVLANKIYSDIEYFGGYGFGLAHAASYAMLGYCTAYLKANYPLEYMAALLTSVSGDKDRITGYLNECKRLGINVIAPSLMQSDAEFGFDDDGNIVFGLSAIGGVGVKIVESILNDRKTKPKYINVYDVFRYADHSILNKGVIHHLINSGALDELALYELYMNRSEKLALLEAEKQELGMYVTDHPLIEVWDSISNKVQDDIKSLYQNKGKARTVLGGIITRSEKKFNKKGQAFYAFDFEDLTGSAEVLVFQKDAAKISQDHIAEGNIGILDAAVSHEGDDDNPSIKLFYNRFEKLDLRTLIGSSPIKLVSKTKLSDHQLTKLYDIIKSKKGDSSVYLEYPENSHIIVLKFEDSTSKELESTLQTIIKLNQEI